MFILANLLKSYFSSNEKEWSSFLQIFITSIEECMILSFDTIGPFMHFQYLNVCSVIVTSYPGALLEKSLRSREPNIIKSMSETLDS